MALINTTEGYKDESELIKRVDTGEEEIGKFTATEYCLVNCPGEAHVTGKRDKPEHFCSLHVHRSVNLEVKEGLEVSGVLNALLGA